MLGDPAPHRGHRLDRLARPASSAAAAASRRGGAAAGGRRRWRSRRGRRRCGGGGVLGRRRGRGRCLRLRAGGRLTVADDGEDVLLRHASAAAGAGDRRRVDAVLGGDAGDDRRDERVARLRCPSASGARRRRRAPRPAAASAAGAGSAAPGVSSSSGSIAASGAGSVGCRRRVAGRPDPGEHGADVDRLALLDEDLGQDAGRRGSAPRCRPCRSRSRAASRRPRRCRPTFFSHLVTVPSETETPICGITTSIPTPVATSTRPAREGRRRRLRPAG